jgi:hypothetical protein
LICSNSSSSSLPGLNRISSGTQTQLFADTDGPLGKPGGVHAGLEVLEVEQQGERADRARLGLPECLLELLDPKGRQGRLLEAALPWRAEAQVLENVGVHDQSPRRLSRR